MNRLAIFRILPLAVAITFLIACPKDSPTGPAATQSPASGGSPDGGTPKRTVASTSTASAVNPCQGAVQLSLKGVGQRGPDGVLEADVCIEKVTFVYAQDYALGLYGDLETSCRKQCKGTPGHPLPNGFVNGSRPGVCGSGTQYSSCTSSDGASNWSCGFPGIVTACNQVADNTLAMCGNSNSVASFSVPVNASVDISSDPNALPSLLVSAVVPVGVIQHVSIAFCGANANFTVPGDTHGARVHRGATFETDVYLGVEVMSRSTTALVATMNLDESLSRAGGNEWQFLPVPWDRIVMDLTVSDLTPGGYIGPAYTLEGTVSSASGISVLTVNGNNTQVDCTTWASTNISPSSQGNTTIAIVARDGRGTIASLVLPVITDTAPPVVSVSSPLRGVYVHAATVNLSINIQDALSGVNWSATRVMIDDQSVDGQLALSSSTLIGSVALLDGSHSLTVIAADNVGNTALFYSVFASSAMPPTVSGSGVITKVGVERAADGLAGYEFVYFNKSLPVGACGADYPTAAVASTQGSLGRALQDPALSALLLGNMVQWTVLQATCDIVPSVVSLQALTPYQSSE